MKSYFFLALIGLLFTLGHSDDPPIKEGLAKLSQVFDSQHTEEAVQNQKGLAVNTSFSVLGEHQATDIYVGAEMLPDEHEVLALFPNYQEVNYQEQEPALFSRSDGRQTNIVDVQLNSKFVNVKENSKVATWDFRQDLDPQLYFKELTESLIETDDNIVAAKYKIRQLNKDNFVLEDIQLIYKRNYNWYTTRLIVKPPNSEKETCYKLSSV